MLCDEPLCATVVQDASWSTVTGDKTVSGLTWSPMKGEKSDSFLKKPLQTARLPSGASSLSTLPSFCLCLKILSCFSSAGELTSIKPASRPYNASLQAAPVEASSRREMMTRESCAGTSL